MLLLKLLSCRNHVKEESINLTFIPQINWKQQSFNYKIKKSSLKQEVWKSLISFQVLKLTFYSNPLIWDVYGKLGLKNSQFGLLSFCTKLLFTHGFRTFQTKTCLKDIFILWHISSIKYLVHYFQIPFL